jgi:hypothetical protein
VLRRRSAPHGLRRRDEFRAGPVGTVERASGQISLESVAE